MVANSELAIERGDFDKALHVLGDVPPDSPAYVRVQVPLKRALQRCYEIGKQRAYARIAAIQFWN